MTVSLMAVLNRELKPVYTMGLRVALARVSHWMKAISSGDGLLHWEQNACQHTSYWDTGGLCCSPGRGRPSRRASSRSGRRPPGDTSHPPVSSLSLCDSGSWSRPAAAILPAGHQRNPTRRSLLSSSPLRASEGDSEAS